MNKQIAAAEVTPEMIEDWKKLHGSVFKHVTSDGHTGYFRKPDLKTLDAASAISGSAPIRSNQILAENCWLAGDRIILESQDHFLGLSDKLRGFVKKIEGELLEL